MTTVTKRQHGQIKRLSRLLEEMGQSGALELLALRCDTGGSLSDVRDAAFHLVATPSEKET